ncbi:TolC family protein [Deltaproteobacteria bacterium PRO3]|nr:TolC family protein [Deltaproteobacteria bacterium PRO3]
MDIGVGSLVMNLVMRAIAAQAWRNVRGLWVLLLCLAAPAPLEAQERPLTWQDCVNEAAIQNPDIVAAIQTVAKARSRIGASRSDYFPQLTPSAGYNASNSANTTGINPTSPIDIDTGTRNQFQVGVVLEQNIFEGFKTSYGVKKSRAEFDDAEANLSLVKSQVSAELKTAFARLLFSQKQVGVAKKILERREENVRFVDLRFEGGRENKGSLMRSQALYEQAKFNLAETQRALKVARRELAKALGREAATVLEKLAVQGSFKTQFPKESPDFAALVVAHPEHRRAEAQLNAGRADVKIAKGDLYPSLDATASATRRKFEDGGSNTLWSAGVNLNYPLFTGGRDFYEVRAARSEEFRLAEALRSGDNRLALQLKQSYADFKDAIERIRVQENFLQSAQVRAEIARSQYANGLISYQDWDQIENDLIDSERTILESLRDALIAEAEWEKAQGRGAIP